MKHVISLIRHRILTNSAVMLQSISKCANTCAVMSFMSTLQVYNSAEERQERLHCRAVQLRFVVANVIILHHHHHRARLSSFWKLQTIKYKKLFRWDSKRYRLKHAIVVTNRLPSSCLRNDVLASRSWANVTMLFTELWQIPHLIIWA